MSTVRPPAVAGSFYPAAPRALAEAVDAHLAAAVTTGREEGPSVRAVIAPHAGYLYSGAIAGSAFRALEPSAATIRRVVLLGPSHFVPLDGLALPRATAFRTPLGDVPVDSAARSALNGLRQMSVDDAPHRREHALEVELPFLQRLLGEFTLVPLVVGEAEPGEVAEVIDRLWDEAGTTVVVSTDLSHYLDSRSARQRDRATADAVMALDESRIGHHDACGRAPLRGLLHSARARGLTARLLDLRNSGDTAGPEDRVVGYGAFALA